MTPTRTVWLVARRELEQGLRNRVLRVTFATMLLLIVAGAFLPLLFVDDAEATTLGVSAQVGVADAELTDAGAVLAMELEVTQVDEATARAQVDDGVLDAALIGTSAAPTMLVRYTADPALHALLGDVVAERSIRDALVDAGVADDVVTEARAAAPTVQVEVLNPPDDPDGVGLAIGGTILLFFGVAFFASRVMSGVVEEKSSRVVEVVLGAVRPQHLLAGKLIGIGLLGLGQILTLVVVAVTALSISGAADLPSAAASTVVGFVGWFVIGFVTYSAVYAAAGALVPRMEDAQSSSGPISTLMFIAYIVTIVLVVPDPDGLAAQILSQVPGIAPLAMPARLALGAVTPVETILAVALSLAATYGAVRLAGVIYQRSILRTQKATWRETLFWTRN